MEQSLIQQRLALGRERVFAIVAMALGGIGLVLAAVALVQGAAGWPQWLQAVAWLLIGGSGVRSWRRSRRRVAEFEAEHGPDAGKQ